MAVGISMEFSGKARSVASVCPSEASWRRWRRDVSSFMVVSLLAMPCLADSPRARTLRYDAPNKDWVESPPPTPGTPEGDLYEIHRLNRDGKYRKALAKLKRFAKKHSEAAGHEPERSIATAEAYIGLRDFARAHAELQIFLNRFSGHALTHDALRLEYLVAEAYLGGVKRKVMGLKLLSGIDLAYNILDQISVDYPDSATAEYATKLKADHLFGSGEHMLAEDEYGRLMTEFPRSRYRRYAMRRVSDAALSSFRGVPYDESALIEAEQKYEDYRATFSQDADQEGVGQILADINRKRAEKEFSIGKYYERTDHGTSAVFYYRSVIRHWPESAAAVEAKMRLRLLGADGSFVDQEQDPSAAETP